MLELSTLTNLGFYDVIKSPGIVFDQGNWQMPTAFNENEQRRNILYCLTCLYFKEGEMTEHS